MTESTPRLRGFAAMSPERRREIADKRSFSQNPALAASAGATGGRAPRTSRP